MHGLATLQRLNNAAAQRRTPRKKRGAEIRTIADAKAILTDFRTAHPEVTKFRERLESELFARKFPEHVKLKALEGKSQAVGDFLYWAAQEKGWNLAMVHRHGPECPGWDAEAEVYDPRPDNRCDYMQDELIQVRMPVPEVLALYFGIDQKRLAEERDLMLLELQTKE